MRFLFGALALFLLGSEACLAQQTKFDFAKLRLNGLAFTTNKTQVVSRLGKPLATVEPHYECGEFASSDGSEKFYQLRYKQAVFIGNSKLGYQLESFSFAPAGPAQLTYGSVKLSTATTLQEFTHLLGPLESHKEKDGAVQVVVWQQDASAIFTFKAGRLVRYEFHGVGC